MKTISDFFKKRIRFDRCELSGAFGDIGTDLPLIIGMILAADLNGAHVFLIYGLMQILTALVYGIPMPVQPLKAVAMIVITQKISSDLIFGGGLAIGVIMLILVFSGAINYIGRIIPKTVIRGIQMGLGLQLAMLALKDYIHADGIGGYILAGSVFIIILALMGNRKVPPAIVVVVIGIIYGIIFNYHGVSLDPGLSVTAHFPGMKSILAGFLLLSLPQIPLSLGNSIYASSRIISDYYPDKKIKPSKIAFTYSVMNIVSSFFGGVPVCHGSGGLAGHYAFGARTGGSVFIYGIFFIVFALIAGSSVNSLMMIFPKSVLGIMLLFEGLALINLVRDSASSRNDFIIVILVALAALTLPYGYLVGIIAGTAIYYLTANRGINIPDAGTKKCQEEV